MAKIKYKYAMKQQKKNWKDISPDQVKSEVVAFTPQLFESGQLACYLHARIYITAKLFSYWACLDVESKTDHSNIKANIQAAQDLLYFLSEHALMDGLSIFMSGSGFRFCWPFMVDLDLKRAFISWIKSMDMIDSGVQTGDRFFRVFGYRGHRSQDTNPRDIHVHKLDSAGDLLNLDVDTYRQMVSGKPNHTISLSWLESILPTQDMPQEWRNFLNGWSVFQRLQDSIFTPAFPTTSSFDNTGTIEQAQAYLDSMGITYTEQISHDTTVLKLSKCPCCDRPGAWVILSGWLKCFHTSCDAGQTGGEYGIEGISPAKWIPGFKHVETVAETVKSCTYQTKEEIWETTPEKLLAQGNKLLDFTPGTGKTHTTIKTFALLLDTQKIAYCSPTNYLNDEIKDAAKTYAPPGANIIRIKARAARVHKDDDRTMCERWEEVKPAAELGYYVSLLYCYNCEKSSSCPYQKQLVEMKQMETGMIILSHKKAAGFDFDKIGTDVLIVDENPLDTFFEKKSKGWPFIKEMVRPHQHGEFTDKIDATLQKAADIKPPDGDDISQSTIRLYTCDLPEGHPYAEIPTLWELAGINASEVNWFYSYVSARYEQFADETEPQWQRRLFKDKINFNTVKILIAMANGSNCYINIKLKDKSKDQANISNSKRFRVVTTDRDLPVFTKKTIVLDGTGDLSETEALFRMPFDLITGKLEIKAQKTLIRRGLGKLKCQKIKKNKPAFLKKLLTEAIQHVRPQDQKILLATHMFLESHLLQICQELMPDREWGSIHFYGNRGINAFEYFDAIICFGQPGTNQPENLDAAMMLYDTPEDRRKWYDRKCDNEAVQTIHRIRPVNGHKNIILMNRKWLPELGPLSCEIDTRKGSDKVEHLTQKVYKIMERFYKIHGFITIEILYALGIGPHSQKKTISKIIPLRLFHLLLYKYIGETTLKPWAIKPNDKPEMILFKRPETISKLFKKLSENHVGQKYEFKTQTQWTSAFGSLVAAQDFYRAVGATFKPDNWRKKG